MTWWGERHFTIRQRVSVWGAMALLIAAACWIEMAGMHDVLQTNLLALLPATERNPVAETAINRLADLTANRAVFLVGAKNSNRAAEAAREFGQTLRSSSAFATVTVDVSSGALDVWRDWLREHRFLLGATADLQALQQSTDPDAWLRQRLQMRLVTPFATPMSLNLADDPFALTQGWASDLPLRGMRLAPEQGVLMVHEDQRSWVLVHATIAGSAYDNNLSTTVLDVVGQAQSTLGDVEVLRAGTVFYAESARRHARKDVDVIGLGSLVGMLILLYGVFRSWRPLGAAVLSVLFGVGAACAATVAWYGRLHLITLVFGVSLIGEAVDYAVQYFAAHLDAGAQWDPLAALRRLTPGLSVALGTSLLGYGALWFSPFTALSQIALFAMVGLFAAWLTVFLLLPWWMARPSTQVLGRRGQLQQLWLNAWQRHMTATRCIALSFMLLGIAATGWTSLHGQDDVRLLVATDVALRHQEEQIKSLTGMDSSSQFFLVEGSDEEDVLQREESLRRALAPAIATGELQSYQAASVFVPSRKQQQASIDAWTSSILSPAARLPAVLAQGGLQDSVAVQLRADFNRERGAELSVTHWLENPISTPWRQLWIGKTAHGVASVVLPIGLRTGADLSELATQVPGVHWVDKPASVSRAFHDYRIYSAYWLAGAVLLVYALLVVRYGLRSAAGVLLPTVLALAVSLGAYGWMGRPLTLFNMMALMLVLGVGVNYAIFLYEGGARSAITFAGVQLSAATTLLSFGLLGLSSMPALAGFGASLAFGIACAVLLSPMALSLAGPREQLP